MKLLTALLAVALLAPVSAWRGAPPPTSLFGAGPRPADGGATRFRGGRAGAPQTPARLRRAALFGAGPRPADGGATRFRGGRAGAPRPANWQYALPGHHWSFPADDGPHPGFANEWWYFTGNLHSADGRVFGFELTFFRIAPAPGTPLDRQIYFTHFAISDISGKTYFDRERAHRGNWGQAGAAETGAGLHLWNENWSADFDTSGPRRLAASWGKESLALALTPGARMLNGIHGYSQKADQARQASDYYSFPRIQAEGDINGVPVSGLVWMDHEFASNQLATYQAGWDWMGLHLPAGDLMLFNLRDTSGARDPHSAGTWKPLHGPTHPLSAADFHMTPLRWWRKYPVAWRVQVPGLKLDLTVSAQLDDQEFVAPASGVRYWEGSVSLAGRSGAAPIGGEGYLELTGYAAPFTLLQSKPHL